MKQSKLIFLFLASLTIVITNSQIINLSFSLLLSSPCMFIKNAAATGLESPYHSIVS